MMGYKEKVIEGTEKYWEMLKDVADPEFPISVVDMGLIRGIEKHNNHLDVTLTFTSTGCGCMDWIENDVREKLLEAEEIESVDIKISWDPAWTIDDMTEEGRNKMKYWGVSS